MKRKKERGYWEKRSERYTDGNQAKTRAGLLRNHGSRNVGHVRVDRDGDDYVVSYSVATAYLEELSRAGIDL
jgi:hypothetical protein